MNTATLRLRKEVTGPRGRVATEEYRAQTQFYFPWRIMMEMLTNSALLVLGRARDSIRSALCVLASEDTGAKRSMLPVAWVGAVMMAAAVVLGMPEKAHAGVCWSKWGCNNHHAYWCKQQCDEDCCDFSAWACVRYGSGPYRCKCW